MNRPDREQQMIDYVTGEMTADERAEFRATLNGDAELHGQLAALTQAMDAVRGHDDETTADLENHIMQAVRKEAAASATPAHRAPSRWRVWGPLSAAAAVVMFVVLVTGPGNPGGGFGGSVAWADVVAAMNRVESFHAIAWADEPRNANQPKMYRVEMYYRAPGQYRAHGFDHVQFHADGESRLYNAAERQWVELDKAQYRLIPPDYIDTLEKKGMLDAILYMLFQDNPPEGQPVRSATVAASAGIEVFDYAHDPDKHWARIWVLKESKLPIRIKVYQPRFDEFTMVTFDYTDPQPASFFDADHFDRVITERRLRGVRQIMRAGAEKLEGKPVGIEQNFDPKRGIKLPELVSIETVDAGDLLITAKHPKNLRPNGRAYAPSYTDQLFDNWGNTYYRVAPPMRRYDDPDEFTDGPIRMTYMAVPPFKQGSGERKVKLRYVVFDRFEDTAMNADILVGEPEATVPASIGAGVPDTWPGYHVLNNPAKRSKALRRFHTTRSPLWVQLDVLNKLKPFDPDGYMVLRHYGLWDEYAAIFERDHLEMTLANPFGDWNRMDQLGQYMLYLKRSGRNDEFEALYQRLKPMEAKFLAGDPKRNVLISNYRRYHIKLAVAMALPRAAEAMDAGQGPKVIAVSRSADGHTVVVTETPPNRNYNASHNWSWGTLADEAAWELVASDIKSGGREKPTVRTWLLKGDAKRVRINYRILITNALDEPKAHESHNNDRFEWRLDIDLLVPQLQTRADLIAKYPQLVERLKHTETPYSQHHKRIDQHRDAGRYAEAIAAAEALLALPREQWPEYYRNDDEAYHIARENYEADIAGCRAKLGQFDESLAILDRIADRTPAADYAKMKHITRWWFLLGAYTHVVDELIAAKQYDRAEALLRKLEARRPDWRMYVDENTAVRTEHGAYGFNPAHKVWSTWKPIDRAWLRLAQARTDEVLPEKIGP